jgi:colicin import membrane protein
VPPGAQSEKLIVEIRLMPDGSLSQPPKALGLGTASGLTQAALRAIQRCAPFRVPATFNAHYDQWNRSRFEFDLTL